tara:strand:- start:7473 stop:8465 length:993 start_codon:yes stop_codon:yes gene_type:complete
MKKFFTKLILFFLILGGLDHSFIIFRKKNVNLFADIASEKVKMMGIDLLSSGFNPEVLVMGSSHVQFGVDTQVLSNETNLESYNAGFGWGTNIYIQKNFLKDYLSLKEAPRLILYGIDVISLGSSKIDEFSDLNQSLSIEKKDRLSSILSRVPLQSKAFMYGSSFVNYLSGLKGGKWTLPIHFYSKVDYSMFETFEGYSITNHGQVKGYGKLNKNYIRYASRSFSVNRVGVDSLAEILNLCSKNDIKIIFFQVPEHKVALQFSKKYEDFNLWMQEFSSKYNVAYMNFNNSESFPIEQDSYFFDSDHLNAKGAKHFTKRLAKKIKPLLNLK